MIHAATASTVLAHHVIKLEALIDEGIQQMIKDKKMEGTVQLSEPIPQALQATIIRLYQNGGWMIKYSGNSSRQFFLSCDVMGYK